MEGKDYITMDYEKNISPAVEWLLKTGEEVPNEVNPDKPLIKFPLQGRLFHPLFQEQEGVYTDMHMTVTALMAFQRVLDANVLPKRNQKLRNIIMRGWAFIQQSAKSSCKEKNPTSCQWDRGMNVPIYVLGHVMYGAKIANQKVLVDKLTKYFRSQKTVNKNMIYWEARPGQKPCENYWDCYHNASNDVELTSYYLLSTISDGQITRENRLIMRYLQSKRNARGGWSSTQDTMMAMTALSVFAKRMGKPTSDNKDFSFKIGKEARTTQINPSNTGVVQIFEAPRGESISEVSVKGSGCVLAQTTVFYNIKEIEEDLSLELSYDAANEKYCVQRLRPAAETLMAVVEIQLPTGYLANQYSLNALMKNSSGWVLRYDNNDDNISVYLDKIGHNQQCFTLRLEKDNNIEVENPQKRSVIAYDYYNTSVRRSIMV